MKIPSLIHVVTLPLLLTIISSGKAQTVLFNDNFSSGSTLNSATPGAPTPTSTSYEMVSSRSWNPAPAIASGDLQFGIGSTSGGGVEVQALFASSPISLLTIGDNIQLEVTFTNAAGILTAKGLLETGLYNSGQIEPVGGGLNGTATSGFSTASSGYAQNWVGYASQLSYSGFNSQFNTRVAQTGSGNNNQDLLHGGGVSSSAGYNNPGPVHLGQSSAPSVTLSAGSQYTEVFQITLVGQGILALTNSVYSGSGTGGTLLSQFDSLASGANYITNSFDGLAFGWYEQGNQATTVDVNEIKVSGMIQAVPEPSGLALISMGLLCLGMVTRIRQK